MTTKACEGPSAPTSGSFLGTINKLRGKTEMHLKIFVDDCCGQEIEKRQAVNGLDQQYFASLRQSAGRQRERQTRARAVSFQMHRLFLPLNEDVNCRLSEGGKMVLDITHLIDRKDVERYVNKFSNHLCCHEAVPDAVVRSWPPYHFVLQLTRGAPFSSTSAGGCASVGGAGRYAG